MVEVDDTVIKTALESLISGQDFRKALHKYTDSLFFNDISDFFNFLEENADIINDDDDWYENLLVEGEALPPEKRATFAGMPKKTIKNIRKTTKKEVMIEEAKESYNFLSTNLPHYIKNIESFALEIPNLKIKNVDLFLILNFLAIRKMQIRGGVQSSFGKIIENKLMDELCDRAGVPATNRDSKFTRDKSKDVDREVDYYLINNKGDEKRCEVKMMGSGNPESADAIIARDTDIFVADTLSEQNKSQMVDRNVKYLECKDNQNVLEEFKQILDQLDIPYEIGEE